MNTQYQRFLYYIGIIALVYVLFAYVVPLLLKAIGFAFKALLVIAVWGAIALAVIMIVMYLVRYFKNTK